MLHQPSLDIMEDPDAVNESKERFDPWLKIWPAANLINLYFSSLKEFETPILSEWGIPFWNPSSTVIELGSGTGLVGLYFATSFPVKRVILTDLACALPALLDNVRSNTNDSICKDSGTLVEVSTLAWGDEADIDHHARMAPSVILCSDVVYFRHLFLPLLNTLRGFRLRLKLRFVWT
jgi:hypothetical protein